MIHARATVLEIHHPLLSLDDPVAVGTMVTRKVRLRVEPEGRPAFEVEQRVRLERAMIPAVGDTVQVIFDPDDLDTLMLDPATSTLVGRSAALRAGADALAEQAGHAREHIQELLAAKASAADPLAQLERLADLRDRGVLTEEEFAAQKAKVLGA